MSFLPASSADERDSDSEGLARISSLAGGHQAPERLPGGHRSSAATGAERSTSFHLYRMESLPGLAAEEDDEGGGGGGRQQHQLVPGAERHMQQQDHYHPSHRTSSLSGQQRTNINLRGWSL